MQERSDRFSVVERVLDAGFVQDSVLPAMQEWHRLMYILYEGWVRIDKELRSWSEMNLCYFLVENQEIFPGFEIVKRDVYPSTKLNGEGVSPTTHFYLVPEKIHSSSFLICFTPGQFVYPRRTDLQPGERLALLKEEAPDLVRLHDNGVGAVYGEREEIGEQLGIWY